MRRCVELFRDVLSLDNVLAHWNRVLAKPEPWVLDYRKTLSDAAVGFILKEDNLKLLALADAEALEAMLPHSAALSTAASDRLIRRRDGRQFIDTKQVDAVVSNKAELEDEDESEDEKPAPEGKKGTPAEAVAQGWSSFSFGGQPVGEVETETETEERKAKESEAPTAPRDSADAEPAEDKAKEEEMNVEVGEMKSALLAAKVRGRKKDIEKKEGEEKEAEVMVVKEPTPTYTFHHDLQRFIKCRQFADVTFAVEGELIPAHKV
jgi:hypothetical protein